MNFDWFNWVVLPLLIYFARICDVSLGTMRIISLSRGMRRLAPVLAFVEILIWLLAIRQIFNHLDNPVCYIAYAGGFASGVYTGMWIEHKVALGYRILRVVTRRDAARLIETLRDRGYGVTVVDAEGNTGMVKIIFTILKRRDIPDAVAQVRRFNPKAFYSIEDVRAAEKGIFPGNGSMQSEFWSHFMRYEKKAK